MTLFQLATVVALLGVGLAVLAVVAIRRQRQRGPAPADPPRAGAGKPASPAPLPRARMRAITPERILDAEIQSGTDIRDTGGVKAVEARLEQGFELYSRGRISIDTYLHMIEQMLREARSEAVRLSAMADEPAATGENALAEARRAVDTLEWCLNWAKTRQTQDGADAA